MVSCPVKAKLKNTAITMTFQLIGTVDFSVPWGRYPAMDPGSWRTLGIQSFLNSLAVVECQGLKWAEIPFTSLLRHYPVVYEDDRNTHLVYLSTGAVIGFERWQEGVGKILHATACHLVIDRCYQA